MADTRERLPDFRTDEFSAVRANQLIAVIERRLNGISDSVRELTADTSEGGPFAPLVHTHVEADITDLKPYLTLDDIRNFVTLDDLSDVDVAGANPGDILQFIVSSPGTWRARVLPPIPQFDPVITDVQLGDLLRYDGTNWSNISESDPGFPFVRRAGDIMEGDLQFPAGRQLTFDATGQIFVNTGASQPWEFHANTGTPINFYDGASTLMVEMTPGGPVVLWNNGIATARTGVSTFEVWDGAAFQDVVLDTRLLEVAGTANQIALTTGQVDLSADRTWTASLPTDVIFPGTGAFVAPSGTTAQRPTATNGMVRYNTDLDSFELYQNNVWVPISPVSAATLQALFTFDSATASADPGTGQFRYDNATPASVNNIFISQTSATAVDLATILGLFGTGDQLYIQDNNDSTRAHLWTVTGALTDNGPWWTIPVALDEGAANPVPNNGSLSLALFLFSPQGGGINLGSLADVDTSTVTQGEMLYKANGLWQNTTGLVWTPATGLKVTGINHEIIQTSDLEVYYSGRNSVGGFRVRVLPTSGRVELVQTASAGAVEDTWISAVRNGTITSYFNNAPAFRSASNSLEIREDGTNWLDIEHAGGGSTGFGPYAFNSATTGPPASGEIRFNNATIGSATQMFIHETNGDSVDVSALLALFSAGSIFYIQESRDSRRWIAFESGTATDNGTDWTFNITNIFVGSQAIRNGNNLDIFGSRSEAAGGGGVPTSRTLEFDGTANQLAFTPNTPQDLTANRSWVANIVDNPVMPGTGAMTLPSGTTAQRPTAAAGLIRYNTDTDRLEFVDTATPAWRTAIYEGGAFHDGFSDFVANEHIDHSAVTLLTQGTANEIDVSGGTLDITASRTWTVGITDNVVLPGTAAMTVVTGTTAQQPAVGNGLMRWDSTTQTLRFVDNGAWRTAIYSGGAFHDGFSDFVANEHVDHSAVLLTVAATTNETTVAEGAQDITASRTFTVGLADNAVMPGTGSMRVPTGTTAQEPTQAAGLIRYDTDTNTLRFVAGAAWRTPAYAGGAFHNGFSDYVANEHIDHSGVLLTVAATANETSVAEGAQDITASRTFTTGLADNIIMPGNERARVPSGTTAQRPGTPVNGDVRYNTTTGLVEFYQSGTWASPLNTGAGTFQTWYTFSTTTTMADPGTGGMRFNNAAPASVTAIAVSDNSLFTDFSTLISFLSKGDLIYIQENAVSNRAYIYEVTADPTDNTTWWQIPVEISEGGSNPLIANNATAFFCIGFTSEGAQLNLTDLVDVTITTPATGQTLYRAASGQWENTGTLIIDPTSNGFIDVIGRSVRVTESAVADVFLRVVNGAGGTRLRTVTGGVTRIDQLSSTGVQQQTWIEMTPNADVELRHNNLARLNTAAAGVTIQTQSGLAEAIINAVTGSDSRLTFQENSADQVRVFHDASASLFRVEMQNTGDAMRIEDTSLIAAVFTPNGAQVFRHNNNVRISTTNDGATIDGVGAIIIPRGTTAQEPTAVNGMLRYDTTTNRLRAVEGGAWVDVTGGGGGGVPTSRTLEFDGTTDQITFTPNTPQDLTVNRSWVAAIADNPVLPGTGSVTVPDGTTAQEPTAVNGMLRYDTTTNRLRMVNNGSWENVAAGEALPTGTTNNSPLVWGGSAWVENTAIGLQTGLGGGQWGATGLLIYGRFTTATESGGLTQTIFSWRDEPGTRIYGEIEFNFAGGGTNGDTMYFRNRRHGGTMEFDGENGAGTLHRMLAMDPAGSVTARHNNNIRLQTIATGIEVLTQSGVAEILIDAVTGQDSRLLFQENGADQTRFFHDASGNIFRVEMVNAGDSFRITDATNISAEFTPNAGQTFRQANTLVARTATQANGAWEIDSGNGFSRTINLDDYIAASLASDQSLTNTTLTAVHTLAMEANTRYRFEFSWRVAVDSADDLQWDMTLPTGAAASGVSIHSDGTSLTPVNFTGASTIVHQTSGGQDHVTVSGYVTVAGTAGNLVVRAAKNANTSGNGTITAGSWGFLLKSS